MTLIYKKNTSGKEKPRNSAKYQAKIIVLDLERGRLKLSLARNYSQLRIVR